MSNRPLLVMGAGTFYPSAAYIVSDGTPSSEVTFTRASSGTYFDSAGILQTAAIDVARNHYLQDGSGLNGLLVEGARTNSLRNSTMVGAATGTPGTIPTNWAVLGASGLTREIVAVGTTSGMDYIDWRISGTSSGTAYSLAYEATTQIVAADSEAWVVSSRLAIVGGDLTNISTIRHRLTERTDVGAFVQDNFSSDIKSSLTSSLTCFPYAVTLSGGGTVARITPGVHFEFSNGVAIDITIRIATPQVEEGSFESSFIPTTTAATTRAADVGTVDLTAVSWFNNAEGTLYADFKRFDNVDTATNAVQVDDGTLNNRMRLYQELAASNLAFTGRVDDGGVSQVGLSDSSGNLNIRGKLALAYKLNDFAFNANDSTLDTDTSGTVPTVTTMRIGSSVSNSHIFGIVSNVRYYNTRLSDAAAQGITT